jgi:hypothetical protein
LGPKQKSGILQFLGIHRQRQRKPQRKNFLQKRKSDQEMRTRNLDHEILPEECIGLREVVGTHRLAARPAPPLGEKWRARGEEKRREEKRREKTLLLRLQV